MLCAVGYRETNAGLPSSKSSSKLAFTALQLSIVQQRPALTKYVTKYVKYVLLGIPDRLV